MFRNAIAIHERSANAWKHLGVALGQQERHDDALVAFERAAQLETESGVDIDGFLNLAINHRDAGRIDLALQIFEKHLLQRPSVEGCHAYSHALLMGGHLRDGWEVAEFRWSREPLLSKRPDFERPVWDGQDLRGKTLLLRAEQGLGDTIQFIRYAPRLKALGATLLLRVPDALAKLARGFPGIDRVLLPDDMPDFDYYCHLMTLPYALRNEVRSIPQDVPYLRVDPDTAAACAVRIPDDNCSTWGWCGLAAHSTNAISTDRLISRHWRHWPV